MTQQNVYNTLKRKKEWMTSKEIAAILEISTGSVCASLNRLFKHGEVLRKNLKPRKMLFGEFGYQPYLWRIK